MRMLARHLALLSVMLVAVATLPVGPAAADDKTTVFSAGPVQIPAGGSADARFLLATVRDAHF